MFLFYHQKNETSQILKIFRIFHWVLEPVAQPLSP